MSHPQYRDAVSVICFIIQCLYTETVSLSPHAQQGTDDHFMSALFAAGAAGDLQDQGKRNYAGAECWELLNMRNVSSCKRHDDCMSDPNGCYAISFQSQFQFGDWPNAPFVTPIHEAQKKVDYIGL